MSNLFIATPAKKKVAHDQENELFATFSFYPPKMDEADRPGLDLAVALDRSTSMSGEKIEAAKQSLLKLIEHLKPDDSLSLVTFDSQIEVIFGQGKMTAEKKGKAQADVKNIHPRASTNLSGGLFKALDFLKGLKKDKGRVRKCLIFTDGQANSGIRDSKQLAEAALEYRNGIGISAFGYGSDHDADLLNEISQDGNFYFIETPDKILHAFGTELGGLVSTFAQNVELRLTPGEGTEIVEVLNDLTVAQDGGQTEGTTPSTATIVTCDDLLAELEYHVVLRLKTDERKKILPRETTLISARAKFVNLITKQAQEETVALKVHFVKPSEADTENNKLVMREVAIQKTANAVTKAGILADGGNYIDAQNVMEENAFFCVDVGAQDIGQISEGLAVQYSASNYANSGSSFSKGAGRMLRSRRYGGAVGQAVGTVDPEILMANLGNAQMKSVTKAFTGDSDGSTLDASPDAVPSVTSSVVSDPMSPQLGSVPNVRVPENDKKEKKDKKNLEKQRSSRW